jgi:hypothetical protein
MVGVPSCISSRITVAPAAVRRSTALGSGTFRKEMAGPMPSGSWDVGSVVSLSSGHSPAPGCWQQPARHRPHSAHKPSGPGAARRLSGRTIHGRAPLRLSRVRDVCDQVKRLR